jgi:hypothetical protein
MSRNRAKSYHTAYISVFIPLASDDQNDRIGLVQSILQSAIAPYLGLVKDYQMRQDEADAALDAFTAQQVGMSGLHA